MGKTLPTPLFEVIMRIISRKFEKILIFDDDISNMNNQDIAYFHTTVIKSPGGESGLAHCITIAPTGKVQPGNVVQYKVIILIK